MRWSTKGRIAVTAMIDIALREKSGPVRLTDIALRQQISMSYLEQLFSKLRLQGLVSSTRGPHGGYELGRRAQDISVTDIILAVDDALSKTKQPVAAPEQDITKHLWDTMSVKMLHFTQSVTLKSLVVRQLATDAKIAQKPLPSHDLFRTPPRPFSRPNTANGASAISQAFQTP